MPMVSQASSVRADDRLGASGLSVAHAGTRGPSELLIMAKIDESEFNKQCIKRKCPALMKGFALEWNATKRWTPRFLRELSKHEIVHIEDGNVMQKETNFHKESLSEFLARLDVKDHNPPQNLTPFLSVFDIFKVFPELKEDVDFSILTKQKFFNLVFAWIGPPGTRTGYHIDKSDNILAQNFGRKEVKLVAPSQTEFMYPSDKFDVGSVCSSVDPENWNEAVHPGFANVTEHTVLLEPGDALFIPKGWWHHVVSLDTSISVNNFGSTFYEFVWHGSIEMTKLFLHSIGLYAAKNCTCHTMIDGKMYRK